VCGDGGRCCICRQQQPSRGASLHIGCFPSKPSGWVLHRKHVFLLLREASSLELRHDVDEQMVVTMTAIPCLYQSAVVSIACQWYVGYAIIPGDVWCGYRVTRGFECRSLSRSGKVHRLFVVHHCTRWMSQPMNLTDNRASNRTYLGISTLSFN
jgi:hypothetical protein